MQVVAVAMGQPKHALHYCGSLAPSVNCLTQEDAQPYFAYGLTQAGVMEVMSPKVMMEGMKASAEGFLPQAPIGDPRMMPGSFIIDRQGIVRWAFYGRDVSEHPEIAAILAAAQALNEATEP